MSMQVLAQTGETNAGRLNYLDNFRVIALFSVVLSHSSTRVSAENLATFEALFQNIVSGATTYFVFMTGFLLQHALTSKVAMRHVYQNKLPKLIFPYLMLGIPLAILRLYFETHGFAPVSPYLENGIEVVPRFFIYIATGLFMTGYWYIPFITVLVLLFPLFSYYIGWPVRRRMACLAAFGILSMLVPRAYHATMHIQMVFHFMAFFLLGLEVAKQREFVIRTMSAYWLVILGTGLAIAGIQTYIGQPSSVVGPPFTFTICDLSTLQKYFLVFGVFLMVERFTKTTRPWLGFIAQMSYAIFLLHGVTLKLLLPVIAATMQLNWLANTLLSAALAMAICIGISVLVRRVLGRKSRYVIGF